ncbi:hypothetical protein KPH14_012906, partial [Odynerus spinipes]
KGPLELPYEGPFKILERISDFQYKIDYKGQPETINIERLKPAFIEEPENTSPPSHADGIDIEESLKQTLKQPNQRANRKVRFVTR